MKENSGRIDLGLSANLSGGKVYIDYAQRLNKSTKWNAEIFANGHAGMIKTGGRYRPRAGALAGFRIRW